MDKCEQIHRIVHKITVKKLHNKNFRLNLKGISVLYAWQMGGKAEIKGPHIWTEEEKSENRMKSIEWKRGPWHNDLLRRTYNKHHARYSKIRMMFIWCKRKANNAQVFDLHKAAN